MYESPKDPDVSFKIEEANIMGISGQVLKYHKALIGAASSPLAQLVNQPPVTIQKGVTAIPVKNATPEAFTAMLKWIYYGEKKIDAFAACELVTVGQFYQLQELQKIASDNMKYYFLSRFTKIL